MNTEMRNQIASIVKKYCGEQRIIDAATSKTVQEAEHHGANARSTVAQRYYDAEQYVRHISPAWATLDATEQHILTEFYGHRTRRTGATGRLITEYGISAREVYYLCAKARRHFADALKATVL